MFPHQKGRAYAHLLVLLCLFSSGVIAQVSALPREPVYLWSEKALVTPDREAVQSERVYAVDNPSITPFWPEPALANGAAVVIFPGGGYVRLAIEHEGYDIARWFNQQGVAAFVVKYRMQEYGFPAPLLDGLRAVRYVRAHAANWNLDAERIGVLGFSAGGHLAASVATRYSFRSAQLTDDPWQNVSARPDFAILGYPVITLEGPDAHAGSRQALLGDNPTPELVRENSLQYQVKAKVPPMFIIHGANDKAVPIGNSLALFAEVQKHNKQSELHIYQTNVHGFGMREGEGTASDWPDALLSWLRHNGWFEKPARQPEVQP